MWEWCSLDLTQRKHLKSTKNVDFENDMYVTADKRVCK